MNSTVFRDVGLGLLAGYLGTKVMEPVSMKLYERESSEAKEREDAVRPGPPYLIAAKKVTGALGVDLPQERMKVLGNIFHYGLGMSWGAVYACIRRRTHMNPIGAGLLTGAGMSVIVDEGMTPALGFSAPNREYPYQTHLRGFIAHLAYGLGVAASWEILRRMTNNHRE